MGKRGFLITFEGGEGTGKTTQIDLMSKALKKKGFKVCITREPGGTPLGEKLRKLLKTMPMGALAELFILETARAEHVEKKIAPALKRGDIVICDRFAESSLVYQGYTRGLPSALVQQANDMATRGLKADWIVLLDGQIGFSRMKARGNLDRIEKEGKRFHRSIQTNYLRLAKKDRRFHTYDADQDKMKLHKAIMLDLETLLRKK